MFTELETVKQFIKMVQRERDPLELGHLRQAASDAERELAVVNQGIHQLVTGQSNGWEPIDTAPTKGRVPILLWRDGMDFPNMAFSDTWWTCGFSHGYEPTHWMLLPPPPETTE